MLISNKDLVLSFNNCYFFYIRKFVIYKYMLNLLIIYVYYIRNLRYVV